MLLAIVCADLCGQRVSLTLGFLQFYYTDPSTGLFFNSVAEYTKLQAMPATSVKAYLELRRARTDHLVS